MYDDWIHGRLRAPYLLHLEVLRSPRRPKRTVVLVHGIGSSTHMWYKLAEQLPDDVRVVAVDLLGFGKSPQPEKGKYDAGTQAKSLLVTLLVHRVPLRSIIVGHSLGALVSVELARRFPMYVQSLLLVSPPIYKPSRNMRIATQREDVLRGIYKVLLKYPKNTERGLLMAKKYFARRTDIAVTQGVNINTYVASLEASIINQSTIEHIADVRMPVTILYGSRDPLVVPRNLKRIGTSHSHIEHTTIRGAGHNVVGVMGSAVEHVIAEMTSRE